MTPIRSLLLAAGLLLCLPCAGQSAAGQPVAAEDLQELVSVLEDETRRAELLKQLRTLLEAQREVSQADQERLASAGARVLGSLSERLQSAGTGLMAAGATLSATPQALVEFVLSLRQPQVRDFWITLIWKVALALLTGWIAELIARRLLGRARRALSTSVRETIWARLLLQCGRLILEIVQILVFALAAYGVVSVVDPSLITRLVALAFINASLIARGVNAVSRIVLSPVAGGVRLIPMPDESASYWWLWARRITNFTVYGYIAIEAGLLLGLPAPVHQVLLNVLGLAVLVMLMMLVQQNRREGARVIAGEAHAGAGRGAALRRRLSKIWHIVAFIYLVAAYVVWVSELSGGFTLIARASLLSVIIIVVAALAARGLGDLIDRGFRLSEDLKARFPLLEQRANRYLPMLKSVANFLIVVLALGAVFQAWSLDVVGWLSSDVGQVLFSRLATIGLILAGAFVFWELISAVIEHLIEKEARSELRSARLQTLLPLARKATMAVMIVMVSLIILSELGVNIAPLLAGAGVVGLAVGFGAQTLVHDIITGVFILVEDSISIGDYIEVGGHGGTVESMSIRTIRMRDVEGNVHTVPFSAVSTVKNYTKEFGFAVMDIGVAYREDVDHVIGVMNEMGDELHQDPEWGQHIIEAPSVMGLQALGDSAVVIRARVKTVAGMQWALRREYYKRVKKRFDEAGIEIPFPHTTVYFGIDKDGTAPAASVRLERPGDPAQESGSA